MEPQPIVGLHVVLPLLLHLCLRRPLHLPPPCASTLPSPEAGAARPDSGHTQPRHGPDLRRDLRRDPPLRRCGDPRDAVVLAAVEDAVPVAPLLPARDAADRPRLLLVVRLLPLPLPPAPPDVLLRPPPPRARRLPPPPPIDPRLHVVSMARILPIFPGRGDLVDDSLLLDRVRVSVLGFDWAAERVLPDRGHVPDVAAWVQSALPFWGSFAAF